MLFLSAILVNMSVWHKHENVFVFTVFEKFVGKKTYYSQYNQLLRTSNQEF